MAGNHIPQIRLSPRFRRRWRRRRITSDTVVRAVHKLNRGEKLTEEEALCLEQVGPKWLLHSDLPRATVASAEAELPQSIGGLLQKDAEDKGGKIIGRPERSDPQL